MKYIIKINNNYLSLSCIGRLPRTTTRSNASLYKKWISADNKMKSLVKKNPDVKFNVEPY